MTDTQPTAPLPPENRPAPVIPVEPFYKRHGLAFAISTLVLSIVVFLGIVTAGAFAVANVVTHVGERAISRVVPAPGDGAPGKRGGGQQGGGQQGGGQQGGGQQGDQQSRMLVRGTIASMSDGTWAIDRQGGSTIDVTVDSSTVYGAPGQSVAKSDFATGDEVVIVGTRSDGAVTATRVLKLDSFPTRPPSTPGTPATPGS
jgi:hypothetical protein